MNVGVSEYDFSAWNLHTYEMRLWHGTGRTPPEQLIAKASRGLDFRYSSTGVPLHTLSSVLAVNGSVLWM